jgi:hypothetical protein
MAREIDGKNTGRGAGQIDDSQNYLGGLTSAGIKRKQSAVIYDILSEGPIEGLATEDARSIFLNGVPVITNDTTQEETTKNIEFKSSDVTYVASTNVVTDNESSNNLFTNMSSTETRYIRIHKAGKEFSSSIITKQGSNVVTINSGSSDTFTSSDLYDHDFHSTDSKVPLDRFLRIPGAGLDGAELVARIKEIVNTKKVIIDDVAFAAVTDVTAHLDLVQQVTKTNDTSGAVVNGGSNNLNANHRNVTNERARLSVDDTFTEESRTNFKKFSWRLQTGELTQEFLPTPVGIGSSAITFNGSKTALNQVTPGSSGSGYPENGADGFKFSTSNASDANAMPNGDASAFAKSASQLGVSNPGEVDHIKIIIGFDRLIGADTETGQSKPSRAEFRITFQHSNDGGSSFIDEVVFGEAGDLSANIENIGVKPASTSNPAGRKYDRSGFLEEGTSSGFIRQTTNTPFNLVYSFDTEQFQPFDDFNVKIERLDAVNFFKDGNQHNNACFLSAIECIIEDKLSYPYTAYSSVIIGAEDFQTIPNRSYDLRGVKVKVPTNYFPRDELDSNGVRRTTASYTRNNTTGADTGSEQDWNGNFRGDKKTFTSATDVNYDLVYTDNPVWIFLDLLTHNRYGIGKFIDPDFDLSLIDKYKLFQIAKFCDELVPDGKGGTEPRFTCNVYLNKQEESLKLLNDFLSVFRGILIWQNGLIGLNSNRQSGAVYTFGKSNVLEGSFQYQSSSYRLRTNQVRVTWNDPENSYKQAVEIVEDYDAIANTGRIIIKDVVAYGCTSQGQAHRYGKWHLFTEQIDNEVVAFKTSINAGFLNPGDIINVQDADREDVKFSGRVNTASSTTNITLDRDVSLTGSGNSFLNLIFPSGGAYLSQPKATINSTTYEAGDLVLLDESGNAIDTLEKSVKVLDDSGNQVLLQWSEYSRVETKQISSISNNNQVVVASAFSSVPNSEVIWSIFEELADGSNTAGSTKQYMVIALEEGEDKIFDISATPYNPEKYDLVDRGYVIPSVPKVLTPPQKVDAVPKPSSLTLTPQLATNSGFSGTSDAVAFNGYDLLVSWTHPLDSDGNIYSFINQYEIEINMQSSRSRDNVVDTIFVDGNTSSITLPNLAPGVSKVAVRLLNSAGHVSYFARAKINFNPEKFLISMNSIGAKNSTPIPVGGTISKPQVLTTTSGLVTIGESTGYSYSHPFKNSVTTYGSGTSINQQSFSSLADGESGFLLIDDSASDLKAIKIIEDNTAENAQGVKQKYSYFGEVGASNDDIVSASGTVTVALDSSEVVGSSTAFTTDYAPGENIIIGAAGTSRFIASISFIESDTKLFMTQVSPRAYSGTSIFKHNLRLSSFNDAIISKITRTNSSSYSIERFTSETQFQKTVQLFKLNDSTFGTTTAGTFADPTNGVESGWSTTQPALSSNNDEVYMVQRTFTSDGASPQDSSWSSPVVVARRTDGSTGSAGLRQVQGYLYYEKTTNTGVAPGTPGSTTYTFSTGDIDGGSGATEVLALADTSATDKWTNSPRTQDVGSTSSFWTVRYSGGESSPSASTCTVSYSTIVAQTAFTGVVTFSGGTTFQEDGSDIFDTTAIDGGNITTGQIDSANLASTRGTRIDLTNDKIIIGGTQNASSLVDGIILDASTAGQPKFFVGDTNSFIRFNNTADKLEIQTSNFSIASNGNVTIDGDVTSSSGTIGGFTIGSTLSATNILLDPSTPKITLGSKATLTDSNSGLYLGTDGLALGASSVFKVTNAGALTATDANITGTIVASDLTVNDATVTGTFVGPTNLQDRAAGAFAVRVTPDITIGVSGDPVGGTSAAYVEIASFGTTPSHGGYSIENFTAGEAGNYSAFYSGVMEDENEDFAGDDQVELLLQVFDNQQSLTLVSKSLVIEAGRALGFTIANDFDGVSGNTYQIRVFARERNGLTTGAKITNNFLQVMRITKGQ